MDPAKRAAASLPEQDSRSPKRHFALSPGAVEAALTEACEGSETIANVVVSLPGGSERTSSPTRGLSEPLYNAVTKAQPRFCTAFILTGDCQFCSHPFALRTDPSHSQARNQEAYDAFALAACPGCVSKVRGASYSTSCAHSSFAIAAVCAQCLKPWRIPWDFQYGECSFPRNLLGTLSRFGSRGRPVGSRGLGTSNEQQLLGTWVSSFVDIFVCSVMSMFGH